MLRTGSSPLPEVGAGVVDGGGPEVITGLCTTGLSAAAVVVVEKGEGKGRTPFAARS